MQQPPKKGLLSPKRVMEIADSLDKKSIAKKKTAYEQRLIGNTTVKNKVADNEVEVDKWGSTLSGNDRLKIADKYFKEASSDSANAARYRSLAENAMKAIALKNKKK
jgi:hypothetical protein